MTNTITSRRTGRALTVAAGTAGALLQWAVSDPWGGLDLAVHQGGADQRIGPAAVTTAALLAGLAAWTLLAALERTARARAEARVREQPARGPEQAARTGEETAREGTGRTTQRPVRTYRMIALVVLLISLTGPLGSGVGLSSKLVLLGMHLTVGLALIIGLPGRCR